MPLGTVRSARVAAENAFCLAAKVSWWEDKGKKKFIRCSADTGEIIRITGKFGRMLTQSIQSTANTKCGQAIRECNKEELVYVCKHRITR